MANRVDVFVHIVWATKQRLPLVGAMIEHAVHDAIAAACQMLKCRPMAVGGMPDHVHLLIALHPTVALSTVVGRAKGSSSHLVNSVLVPDGLFEWQRNYGAFSIGHQDVDAVVEYIRRQKQHHTNGTLIGTLEAIDTPQRPAPSPRMRASS